MSSLSLRILTLAVLGTSCTASPPPSTNAPVVRVAAEEPAPPERTPTWVLQLERVAEGSRVPLDDGRLGVVVGNTRAVVDERGAVVEVADLDLSVSRALALPARLGGGVLFLGNGGAWIAPRFVGQPSPIALGDIAHAAIGTDFLLLVDDHGSATAFDPVARALKKLPVAGIVDLATSDDGLSAAALTLHGLAFVTRDGGAKWQDVTSTLPGAALEARVHDGRATFVLEGQVWQSVTSEGFATRAALTSPAKKPRFGPPWTNSTSPLAWAAQTGAPIDDTHALVVDRGDLFVIRTTSGVVVGHEAGVVPPGYTCELTALTRDVLLLCRGNGRTLVLRRSRAGAPTRVERRFEGTSSFVRGGDDALLFVGPCEGSDVVPGVACARGDDGTWRELDHRGVVSDRAEDDRADLVSWVPTKSGALLFVFGPKSAVVVDTSNGSTRPIESVRSSDLGQHLAALRRILQPQRGPLLDWRFHVDADGHLEGWDTGDRAVRVSADLRTIERSPFDLQGSTRGPVAVGRGANGGLFQSKDWGRTFQEVDRAPFAMQPHESVGTCSEVGCVAGVWVRVGFPEDPPTPKTTSLRNVQTLTRQAAALPRLVCKSTGPVKRRARTPLDGERPGFGAEAEVDDGATFRGIFRPGAPAGRFGSTVGTGLLAIVSGPMPDPSRPTSGNEPRRLRFVDPFDPEATVRSSSLRLDAWLDATRSVGGRPLDLSTSDATGIALPVNGEGLALLGDDSSLTWIRSTKVMVLSLGAEGVGSAIESVAQAGPDELVVRSLDFGGKPVLLRLGPGLLTTERKLPDLGIVEGTHGDAVARLDDGSFAVVRASRFTPPTIEQPAWLLRQGSPPQALAPWATLTADGAPGCEGTAGARVVITARRSWLDSGTLSTDEELPFLARVRWTSDRVCLEAVAAPFARHELSFASFDSALVARFGKDAKAGHVLLGQGAELREPRSCTIEPAALSGR